ncbi:hypothetical protein [Novosphingobium sp.]|uniref:hypothetical protein n=1 Tax=Novosphingobium sp. TaxID=1874826 RepID=UPI0031DA2CD9
MLPYITPTGQILPAPRPIDTQRLIAAFRNKRPAAARPAPGPLPIAASNEPCWCCGIPGFKGCDHQLPYEAPKPAEFSRSAQQRFYGGNPHG